MTESRCGAAAPCGQTSWLARNSRVRKPANRKSQDASYQFLDFKGTFMFNCTVQIGNRVQTGMRLEPIYDAHV